MHPYIPKLRFKLPNNARIVFLVTQTIISTMAYAHKIDSSQRMDHFGDEDSLTQIEESEGKATATIQTGRRKIQVTCEVENTDFISQCQAEREKARKDKNPDENDKDEKESHSPKASVKIRWSSGK
jgi:hypothetical protein